MIDVSKDADSTSATIHTLATASKENGSDINTPDIASDPFDINDEYEYASGIGLLLLINSLMLGMFLVALDNMRSPFYLCISPKTDQHPRSRPSSVPQSEDNRRISRLEQGLVVRRGVLRDFWRLTIYLWGAL
jgi:hypothetical protein